jgi:hypothetical protein
VFQKTQDRDLWLRFAERGRIACLDNCLVRVRKHPEQISSSAAGTLQLVYGAAASTCHFLRVHGYPDPSTGNDKKIWQELITWVDRRMKEEGVLGRRKAWAEARAEYFAMENRLAGAFRFGIRLLRSGHAGALAWEKRYGYSLPRRLAREWMVGEAQ